MDMMAASLFLQRKRPILTDYFAPGTENKPYTMFEVVKPVEVQSGKIAPWFGVEGGGIQYEFSNPISELLEQ